MATIKGKMCATKNSGSQYKITHLFFSIQCFQLYLYVDATKNTNTFSVSPHPLYVPAYGISDNC